MILNNILLGIKAEWSIIEKVRYIYIMICKEIKYDERFLYSKNPKLLKRIYYKSVSINEDIDSKVVCNTANILFSQLMNRLGIKNKLIYKKSKIKREIDIYDVACVFYDENGNKYYTNIVGDIENCKFGLKTAFFGTIENEYEEAQDVSPILSDTLFQIDRKIGYIKKYYSDIVLELLKSEVKNTNNFKNFLKRQNIDIEKLSEEQIIRYKIIFLNEYVKFRDKTAGPFEKKKFYKTLFGNSVLNKLEKRNFESYEYIKEEGENVDIILLIVINLQTNPTYFYYSNENECYITIRKEDLQKMLKGYRSNKENKNIFNFNVVRDTENNNIKLSEK